MNNHSLEYTSILSSYEDFLIWYLGRADLSMFCTEDIRGLLEEVKPTEYPCIPVLTPDSFEVYCYIAPEMMRSWCAGVGVGPFLPINSSLLP
jgi:hypothetical protein